MNQPFSSDRKTCIDYRWWHRHWVGYCQSYAGGRRQCCIMGRRIDVLEQAVASLMGNAVYVQGDVSDLASLPGLIKKIEEEKGPIDVLVNNAGINMKKMALEVTDEEFQRIVHTNLNGVFAMCREVGKYMQKEKPV